MKEQEFVGPILIYFERKVTYDSDVAVFYPSDEWVDEFDPWGLFVEIYTKERIAGVAVFGRLSPCGEDVYFVGSRATPFMVVTSEISAAQPFNGSLKGSEKLMTTIRNMLGVGTSPALS